MVVKELPEASGNSLTTIVQYVKRGDFQQRVSNNPTVDYVRSYQIGNITTSVGFSDDLEVDFMLLNVTDEASSVTFKSIKSTSRSSLKPTLVVIFPI